MLELFKKYIDNQCSPEEVRQLLGDFDARANEILLKGLIRQQLESEEVNSFKGPDLDKVLEDSIRHIKAQIAFERGEETAPVVPLTSRKWFRYAAAAVFVVLVGGALVMLNQPVENKQEVATLQPVNDVAPGGNKAVLTLSDNSVIVLDNAANGILGQQGNTRITKLDNGQIAYNASGDAKEVLYNTITTPMGGQYQMTLTDGSKVWLNAGSTLKFPVAFTQKERRVEITGEVYFEVASIKVPKTGARQPFIVEVGNLGEVEVLGTHFNVKAYSDEEAIKTTLLEGSVRVAKGQESVLIKPGQQAVLTNGGLKVNPNVNLEEAVAWKNGLFQFTNADIEMVMKEIGRWYNVEVSYPQGVPKDKYWGSILRNQNLSNVLKVLKESGANFIIEDRKIIVTPTLKS